MKKYIIMAVLGMTLSFPAASSEWGLGISIPENETKIFFPINIGEQFRVEPFLSYYRTSTKVSQSDNVVTAREVGLGIFHMIQSSDSTMLYYGGRGSYYSYQQVSKWKNNSVEFPSDVSKLENDGYRVSATIGFEYGLTEALHIAGEAEIVSSKESGNNGVNNFSSSDQEIRVSTTKTSLILRYFF